MMRRMIRQAILLSAAGLLVEPSSALPQTDFVKSTNLSALPTDCKSGDGECPSICRLDSSEPGNWAESGAMDYLDEFLGDNGEKDWLNNMHGNVFDGEDSAIDCSFIESQRCALAVDTPCSEFDPPEWYWVRLVSTRINEVFSSAKAALVDSAIADGLQIENMIQAFKFEVNEDETGDILGKIGGALGVAGTIVGMVPGAAPFGTAVGLLGGVFGVVSANMPEPDEVDDTGLQAEVKGYLGSFFKESASVFERTLAAIFGKAESGDSDLLDKLVKAIEKGGFGGSDIKTNHTISKILSGGAWLEDHQESILSKALEATVSNIQHGILSRILTVKGFVVVEWDRPTKAQCDWLRTGIWIDDKCYFLAQRMPGETHHEGISIEQRDALTKYGPDSLEDVYRNVRACKNGDPSKDINLDGKYPKCFFDLPFFIGNKDFHLPMKYATPVSEWDYPGSTDDLPNEALQLRAKGDYKGHDDRYSPRDRDPAKWDELDPPSCFVNTHTRSDWSKSGLRRYRTEFHGIDLPEGHKTEHFCDYIGTSRCSGMANKQCYYHEDSETWVVNLSWVAGAAGKTYNGDCIRRARQDWELDTKCGTGSGWGYYNPWEFANERNSEKGKSD